MFKRGFLSCAVLRWRGCEANARAYKPSTGWYQAQRPLKRSFCGWKEVTYKQNWSSVGRTQWHSTHLEKAAMDSTMPLPLPDESEVIKTLYPKTEPFDSGYLKVSSLHRIFYQQFGQKNGKPVLFLHGGPGAGVDELEPCFFDPDVYRAVVFDQRGAGKSEPTAELQENTTWDLVEDIEKLRKHLGIDRWVVFGGSWGSALSLAYSETHPDRVKAMVLRGIFAVRKSELEWLYEDRGGACMLFPDYFDLYRNFIPQVKSKVLGGSQVNLSTYFNIVLIAEGERRDMLGAYYRRLTGDDEKLRLEAAKVYTRWEMSTSRLYVDEMLIAQAEDDKMALQFARIGVHYFVNGGFFETDTQLLDNVDRIRHIPATIIQGRYDAVCVPETAWQLHKRWPEAEFRFVPAAGHSAMEPGVTSLLVKAADKYKLLP